ncbi:MULTISPECIES: DUF5590 domain-containing protein [Paenibacillus]|uniref:Uncharacterized protein n=1 Tax=Paenibacillus taichungensis TaxID=484184 RepID=A0A329R149_9BACL|nr:MULTISPECIES: DUF5590 domain-containing protein [Paenibacillus]MCZ1267809.1 hypothetical protein [Paenibacillus tundrae]RAW18277.1 hypothetical protein DC345_03840 [Paenibacillus taichungensis]WDQ31678.1 DUF5590 domain-containing protein [Paenibacillus marchantiae]SHN64080.1 Uncharacterized protein YpmB [Paenibacillus sp. ov031]SLJ90896.1 Uncharacterized protein YpmB [Paenibacillus sp. RU5A]
MKKKKKWIWISLLLLVLILFGLQRYYVYVTQDQRKEEALAIQAAQEQLGITSHEELRKYVWGQKDGGDNIYWTLIGKNKDNQDVMVWIKFDENNKPVTGTNAVHGELLKNGMNEAQIRNRFSSEVPGGEIKRIMPGVVNGIYVWQVYYNDDTHNYYRFYRFSNGEQVDLVYTIPNS